MHPVVRERNCDWQHLNFEHWNTVLGHAGVCVCKPNDIPPQAASISAAGRLCSLRAPLSRALSSELTSVATHRVILAAAGYRCPAGSEFLKQWHLGVSWSLQWSSLARIPALLAIWKLGSVLVACWPSQKSTCLWLVLPKELKASKVKSLW